MSLYEVYLAHPSVQTDTRRLQPGDLFFALKGPSFNGNDFALQALAQGAAYAVVDDPALAGAERCILVPDVLEALQELAHQHRMRLDIPFLAITGSNGKTTTKELITAVLRRRFRTAATEGNLNNHIGVPLTLLCIPPDAEFAVVEMGANHIGEIASYCRVALPSHGLITNCGKAHLEGFGSEEGIRIAKGELYDSLRRTSGTVFRNADLPYLEDMAAGIAQQITYGSGSAAQYRGRPDPEGVFLRIADVQGRAGADFPTKLVGGYNFPNAMVAIAVGLHFGVPEEEIRAALVEYNPGNSRSQWLQRGGNSIVMDAYNANPSSMRAAIENFGASKLPRKRLWLGAMKEMGPEERTEHALLVALIKQWPWEEVVLVGKEFKGLEEDYRWFPDSAGAAAAIAENPPAGASILLKGSRGSRMEVMLEALPF